MNHAVLLTSYPFPCFAATSNRVFSLAKGLAADKLFKVTVIGPGSDKSIKDLNIDNELFSLVSINQKPYKGRNLFIRALTELKLFIHLISNAIKCNPDIIIVTIPSIFLLGTLYLKKKNIPIIIDIRDLVWEYFIQKSFIYKIIGIWIKMVSLFSLRYADLITVTNHAELNKLSNNYLSPTIITNGLDNRRFNQLISLFNKDYRKYCNSINITYAGNIGFAQKLHTLIDAVRDLENVKVTLIGSGRDYYRLINYIDDNNIKNVNMTGELDWRNILEHYQKTDMFFVQIGQEFTTALPSKIFEYLATGKRLILAAPDGPATELALLFNGIHIVEPENSDLLKEKIISVIPRKNDIFPFNVNIIREKFLRESQATIFSNMVRNL